MSIEKLYRTWGDVAVGVDEDSDEDESEEESGEESEDDEEEDEEDEGEMGDSPLSHHLSPRMIPRVTESGKIKNSLSTSADRRRILRSANGELSSSFDGMSISPAFSGLGPSS
jgi:hypothetical protein